ncbi:MAG: universal stress protein [Thermoplasmata archaeon]
MYHRLLIPVNQAAEVEPLIRFAAQLLDADGEIRLLHVIPHVSLPEITKAWRESVHIVVPAHETAAALDVLVDPEVRVAPDVAGEIVESATSHAVDGILMTLRGSPRSPNPFVGHTASTILQHATPDVLLVNRLALATQSFTQILVPSFMGGGPSPKAMQLAEALSLKHDSVPIVSLTISSEPLTHEETPQTSRTPRGLELRHRHTLLPESLLGRRHRIPDLILSAAARERYGFLMVVEDRQNVRGPLITRRFVEDLFRSAPCPVMAVRG